MHNYKIENTPLIEIKSNKNEKEKITTVFFLTTMKEFFLLDEPL